VVTGLARVTVSAPNRRLDLAVPEQAPLSELLPVLLRHAGEDLADAGQSHGGWVLRRGDGTALTPGSGLAAQGIRDGDVVHLVPARAGWPELEYDDVVDAIAVAARRHGRGWDGTATRFTGIAMAGLVFAAGLVALARVGAAASNAVPGTVCLAVAGLLLAAGVLASRVYADAPTGAALAGYALVYALAAGALLPRAAAPAAPRALVGCAALALTAVLGAVGIGHALRVFVGGTVAGLAGATGALLAFVLPPAGAAAAVVACLVTGTAAVPLLAIRLGKLPMPVLTPASASQPRPDRARVHAAVVRTDEMLTGMLFGIAVAVAGGAVLLVGWGGVGGRVLVAVAGGTLALRARLFPTVRQRLPLLLAGAACYLVLVGAEIAGARTVGLPVVAGLVAVALVLAVAGSVYRRRPPGPYAGRLADLVDAVCVAAVVPAACAALGLFGAVRNLVS
jgi:type VII secretion integral membrane protein EccD